MNSINKSSIYCPICGKLYPDIKRICYSCREQQTTASKEQQSKATTPNFTHPLKNESPEVNNPLPTAHYNQRIDIVEKSADLVYKKILTNKLVFGIILIVVGIIFYVVSKSIPDYTYAQSEGRPYLIIGIISFLAGGILVAFGVVKK